MEQSIFYHKDLAKENHEAMDGFLPQMSHYFPVCFKVFFKSFCLWNLQLQLTILSVYHFFLFVLIYSRYGLLFLCEIYQHKVFARTCIQRPSRLQQNNQQMSCDWVYTLLLAPYILAYLKYLEHFRASKLLLYRNRLF